MAAYGSSICLKICGWKGSTTQLTAFFNVLKA